MADMFGTTRTCDACSISYVLGSSPRHQLMDSAISEGSIVLERTIDVHIKTLRKKLGDAQEESADMIETVRGVGYRFRETLEAA